MGGIIIIKTKPSLMTKYDITDAQWWVSVWHRMWSCCFGRWHCCRILSDCRCESDVPAKQTAPVKSLRWY